MLMVQCRRWDPLFLSDVFPWQHRSGSVRIAVSAGKRHVQAVSRLDPPWGFPENSP